MKESIQTMFDLSGKVALITGGHSWLGFDMAGALAAMGCHIALASRNQEKLEKAAAELSENYGIQVFLFQADLRFPGQVQAMADAVYAWKGHIDILINNAGGGSGASEGNFFKRDLRDISDMITVNLLGPLYCCQSVGRYMARHNSGKIINIGSIAGVVGRDRDMYRRNHKMEQPVDYAASKAGIIGMTRDLAAFMAPYQVQVNCISPGGFDKGDLPQGFVSDYANATMAGRMGTMGLDIKGAALFLASPASDYVTGHNLMVDGGFSVFK